MTSSEPQSEFYRPFPGFDGWLRETFDTSAYDEYTALLATARLNADPSILEATMTTSMRYAAVDTNAIEGIYETDRGFTRTVATQAASWEVSMEARGPHVRPAFTDALNAYEYVLDAATRQVVITEVWIRELHAVVCHSQKTYRVHTEIGPQDRPLVKGTYKLLPNSPTMKSSGKVHPYAPVLDTPPEMTRFVNELRSPGFLAAHPIVQAAYAHYAYVCIHPFPDGNGRVARALASVFLYRAPGVPLVIFADQRNGYYDSLEAADIGDPEPFVQFIATHVLDTINIVRVTLEQKSPPVQKSLGNLRTLFNVDVLNDQLRPAALRLKSSIYVQLAIQFNELDLPPQLSAHVNPNKVAHVMPPDGYGTIGDQGAFYIMASSDWPVSVRLVRPVAVLVRDGGVALSDLLVMSESGMRLEVMLAEIDPIESESLTIKIRAWVGGFLAEFFADVEGLVQRAQKR